MKEQELNELLDSTIGTKGNFRIPSYWMRKVFSSLMEWCKGLTPNIDIPTKISQLENDVELTTQSYVDDCITEINNNINTSLSTVTDFNIVQVTPGSEFLRLDIPFTNGYSYSLKPLNGYWKLLTPKQGKYILVGMLKMFGFQDNSGDRWVEANNDSWELCEITIHSSGYVNTNEVWDVRKLNKPSIYTLKTRTSGTKKIRESIGEWEITGLLTDDNWITKNVETNGVYVNVTEGVKYYDCSIPQLDRIDTNLNFYGCEFEEVEIPSGKYFYFDFFREALTDTYIFPENIQQIRYYTSDSSRPLAIKVLNFSKALQIPTITNSSGGVGNDIEKIIVPDTLYDNWIVADKWSAYADKIVKASEYTE